MGTTTTTTTTTRTTTTTTRTTTRRTTTTTRAPTTTTKTTTDRPLVFPTRPRVIGFDDDGKQVTLHAAEADIPGPPNNFVGVNVVDSNSQLDLELESIFTEECLVSEDCGLAAYCDLTDNKCKSACSLNGKS